MNTNTMELNSNMMELNLDELELISGGKWNWKDAIIGGVIGGFSLGMLGQCLDGVPGALIGGAIGVGLGTALPAVV